MKKKARRIIKRTMIVALILIATLAVATLLFLQQAQFGKKPTGARLEAIQNSPNYKDGQFQNLSPTPNFAEDHSMPAVMWEFLFGKSSRAKPVDLIPSVKTNLHNLPPDSNVLVWFGHSSYFMQVDGLRFLVDPVFSGNASPVPGSMKAFKGTDRYTVADLPTIDYLLITHDHYDHLDHKSIIALKEKTSKVICGLGVGAHLEHWGYVPDNIIEKDWYQRVELNSTITLFTEPARHFSGRGLSRNNTLWLSFVLQTPNTKIFIGGDSGYDTHYTDIGKRHGSFDLAILENGQYNKAWPYIHHQPEEVLKAAQDLKAKRVLPVHSSKFSLALHAWDEPLARISELNSSYQIPLVTPIIGELVNLDNASQQFTPWWVGLE